MFSTRPVSQGKTLCRALLRQRGFTLIELVAVMAIMAVLVLVVAPSVINSRNASVNAQTLQDATQVRSSAAKYFNSQKEAEVRTPHSVVPTTKLAGMTAGTTSATQKVSSKWPERYITTANATSFPASYAHVFQTTTDPMVKEVVLQNEDGEAISGSTLLTGFTAVNLDILESEKLLAKKPVGAEMESDGAPNFLWLFEKTSSSAAPQNAGDSREVVVFKLVKVEKLEGQTTASGAQKVKLTYRQIFGSIPAMPTPTPTPTPTATPTATPTPTPTATPTPTPTATPAAGDTWATAGPMSTARGSHIAIRLSNGKVLAMGGAGATGYLNSPELFDPSTGTWSATGSMTYSRVGHAAVLLTNGKTLVIGGVSANVCAGAPVSNSAELYDPATGTWVLTGNMNAARNSPAAVVLANGKVLVAGGGDRCGGVFSSAELYDPATGTWTLTGPMNVARQEPAAVLLSSGKVLVGGGTGSYPFPSLASAEFYDPATGTWTLTGSMQNPRIWASDDMSAPDGLILLSNGKVLTAGGVNRTCGEGGCGGSSTYLSAAELYDPATGTWTATGSMASVRMGHRTVLLSTGKVLVTGGSTQAGTILKTAEIYDPVPGTWSPAASITTARAWHTATLLTNSQVLAAGGYDGVGIVNSAEAYTPTPTGWVLKAPMPQAGHGASIGVSGGRIDLVHLYNSGQQSNHYRYDPGTNTWLANPALPPDVGTDKGSAVVFSASANSDVLYEIGGTNCCVDINTVYAFTFSTNSWSTVASQPIGQSRSATGVIDGKIYVAGGHGDSNATLRNILQVYDPVANTWSTKASMSTARNGVVGAVVGGLFYVIGGVIDATGNTVTSVQVYDPFANTWTTKASMATGRAEASVAVVAGRIYVMGGRTGSTYYSGVEIYDPATDLWTAAPSMGVARAAARAAEVGGVIYVFGGYNASGELNSVEALTVP